MINLLIYFHLNFVFLVLIHLFIYLYLIISHFLYPLIISVFVDYYLLYSDISLFAHKVHLSFFYIIYLYFIVHFIFSVNFHCFMKELEFYLILFEVMIQVALFLITNLYHYLHQQFLQFSHFVEVTICFHQFGKKLH